MSAGGARRGRRDNGLDASEYAVVGDVDPRVGEHLLDVLAAGGIAAYLQPSADLNPITRTTTVPSRPVDRLYVDRAHVETARGYLAQLTEENIPSSAGAARDPDVDAAWASIVAGYHAEVDPAAAPWPAAEGLPTEARETPASPDRGAVGTRADGPAPDGDGGGAPTTPERGTEPRRLPYAGDISGISLGRRPDEPSLLDGLDTFGADLPDDDEGYTPPPPPPLPRVSKYAAVGVLGIVAGFVLFFFPDLLPVDRALVTVIGFASVLAGFVTLIWRLRPDKDDDERDPDDGAVV
ncbi:hypothetical protein SAMN05444365_105131 [Micromonospora pattaloongensis]|uniref:DUF308 domain-containing protein n=1 Tax=Micromonospora pattaloongensis TaxID=405436 RepID=A0A1H3PZW0_9ACTN|nr:DUF308 domain-containing protein [Micromonospora pattaloongensis]SDZ06513.1 hypothetical protein SAMN05444365_105131 [Micromonospora pattaloongensis]